MAFVLAPRTLAATAVVGFVALGGRLRAGFVRAGGRVAGAAGALVTLLALGSLVVVAVNVQGAVAPFASLMSMLPIGGPDAQLGDTVEQVRRSLAGHPVSGAHTPPALGVIIGDFARYHAAMALIAGIVAVVLIGLGVVAWTRFARTGSSDRRTRLVWVFLGVTSAVASLASVVVIVANATTAADPAPALLGFFTSGS